MYFTDVVELFAGLLRTVGAATFGLGLSWLTLQAYRWEKGGWELAAASTLGLMATFALTALWVPGAATLGGFGVGSGAGILIWGLGQREEAPKPRTRRTTTSRRTTTKK